MLLCHRCNRKLCPMLRLSACLMSLAISTAVSASPGAPQKMDDEVIVVTGTVMDKKEARDRSRAHVAAVFGTPVSGQNARWSSPLCIAIVGIQPTTAVPVLNRIEAVATSAGAKLGKKGCSPNVVVHFTADADADLAAIDRKRPDLLEDLPEAERKWQEGHLQALAGVQARVALRLITAAQAFIGNGDCPAGAFGHVLPGHFQVDAARRGCLPRGARQRSSSLPTECGRRAAS
jgi:hypothetical protein